ncbi:hypothetical protein [Frankia sp. Cas3]|uniref:hypothetical protein n=1 Tax=Frankia sp. Cas3 TaxID=3073926 RepID=UPI002AD5A00B|nr:hypothetical protein [Frankia sp. Cas3]
MIVSFRVGEAHLWKKPGEVIGGGDQRPVEIVGVVLPPVVEVLHPGGGHDGQHEVAVVGT